MRVHITHIVLANRSPLQRKKGDGIVKKKSIVAILAVLAIVSMASGTLLDYFGQIETTGTIEQAVVVDDTEDNSTVAESGDATGGETMLGDSHDMNNRANVPINVTLDTTVNNGVTYGYVDSVTLENKQDFSEDGDWNVVDNDNRKAELQFGLVGNKLNYTLDATGLDNETEYMLIYYADQPDRFVDWGGAPALELGSGTPDDDGNLTLSGSEETNGNLPYADDWNDGPEADYCTEPDNYEHCTGAKIWLIPTDDYDGEDKTLTAWNPENYLFETDLIRYFDNTEDELTIPADGSVDLQMAYTFASNYEESYTATTTIYPGG